MAATIRIVKTIAMITSTLFSGITLSYSVLLIPSIQLSPTPLMLKQWKKPFLQGKRLAPPLFLSAAFSFFYLAHRAREVSLAAVGGVGRSSAGLRHADWVTYLLCGSLAFGVLPLTVGVIEITNQRLLWLEKEVSAVVARGGETKVLEEEGRLLVGRWAKLNMVRFYMMAVASVLGGWTLMGL